MGCYRPVSQYNAGKKSEYRERLLLHPTAVVREVI